MKSHRKNLMDYEICGLQAHPQCTLGSNKFGAFGDFFYGLQSSSPLKCKKAKVLQTLLMNTFSGTSLPFIFFRYILVCILIIV